MYLLIIILDEEMERIFNEDLVLVKSMRKNDDSINSLEDEGFISGKINILLNLLECLITPV